MSTSSLPQAAASSPDRTGLAFWMQGVLEECDRVAADFSPDPVHDLRVALRRCRSLADGLMAIDPDKNWKSMKKAGKQLFQSLGELRDLHVMADWLHHLAPDDDPAAHVITDYAAFREPQLRREALAALDSFDRKRWTDWSTQLPRRAARVTPGSAIFRHMALERWTEAQALHSAALRGRSAPAWHRLRIGIKRFRYTVENFLPDLHQVWKDDLKQLQDQLGEVHDLDVIWAKAIELDAFPNPEARSLWAEKIHSERAKRIEAYRQKMIGKHSLWQVWRAALPQDKEIAAAALSRLRLWASFLDPQPAHSRQVTSLALQIFDQLAISGVQPKAIEPSLRDILRVAAIAHDVGRAKKDKNHHKRSQRLLTELKPPLGWTAEELELAGIVARYHRGALPQARHQSLNRLGADRKTQALYLSAILRLANALDLTAGNRAHHLKLEAPEGMIVIAVEGYSARDSVAEKIGARRHLLEQVLGRPIMIKALRSAIHRVR